ILGVVGVIQDLMTHAKDHGAVPVQQGREGRLVALSDEAFHELAVAQLGSPHRGRDRPDEAQQGVEGCRGHAVGVPVSWSRGPWSGGPCGIVPAAGRPLARFWYFIRRSMVPNRLALARRLAGRKPAAAIFFLFLEKCP